jgi:hypothetical protein
MTNISRRAMLLSGAVLGAAAFGWAAKADSVKSLTKFRPGEVWLDTAGKPIHAHGGSILKVGDTFYWYGENKEKSLPNSGVWAWGMRIYSSKDLYNWTDEGLFIPPDLKDPKSSFAPASLADRPHIIYNEGTKKFVCWVKIMHREDWSQTRTVLVADKITGPYTMVRDNVKPFGMSAGDFDMVVAPDGKAYFIFERVHTEMIVADLTDDYTDVTGYYSTHFPKTHPPFTREGPGYFFRNGKHYLFTSGTSGYHANPSEVAVADTYHGPWTVLGDAHPKDVTRTSFNSQICSVFKHPGKKDLYIALADRWVYNLPDLEGPGFYTGEASKVFQGYYDKEFAAGGSTLTAEEDKKLHDLEAQIDSSKARYVWLPVKFDGDRPYIDWRDEWSLDEFA